MDSPLTSIAVCLCLALCVSGGFAYESDQYLYRTAEVADSLPLMDARVNDALVQIAATWSGPRDDARFARAVYRELGGLYWVDHIERWANANPAIRKYPQTRFRSVYRGMPIWATRVNYLFGVARSMRVGGVRVGTDKFGHFFSQGLKYYKRHKRGWSDERVFGRGAFAERWIFGKLTTGVYANADLVANYEGMRFYASLFEDDVRSGKPALVGWSEDGPVIARPFTWTDHVTDYWDEALNPGPMVPALEKRLHARMLGLCDAARAVPAAYSSPEDDALWERYEKIGLKDARHMQFTSVCSL
ncbi:MAG: hypothetical protein CMD83_12750 [Gammaproteobacteria bacterium]|nr:hypothetical protein [Gammaproteobacteria bacterium]